MITPEQYFGDKPHSEEQAECATNLLYRVNALIVEACAAGSFTECLDPDTDTQISGAKNGAGDGGFRLPTSTTGSAQSSHKEAKAVDVFDPVGRLDAWLTDEILEKYGLYRESPLATVGWTHLTTRSPHSGKRTFQP